MELQFCLDLLEALLEATAGAKVNRVGAMRIGGPRIKGEGTREGSFRGCHVPVEHARQPAQSGMGRGEVWVQGEGAAATEDLPQDVDATRETGVGDRAG